VANNIFYLKENRRKLQGHKIASSTHKIAPTIFVMATPISSDTSLLQERKPAHFSSSLPENGKTI
jgi:hypothetical protein